MSDNEEDSKSEGTQVTNVTGVLSESTQSISEIELQTRTEDVSNRIGKLLGEKTKPKIDEELFLLRFTRKDIPEKFVKKFSISKKNKANFLTVGPVLQSEVEEWIEDKLLEPGDEVLGSYSRWLPVDRAFPDKIEFVKPEITKTSTLKTDTFDHDFEDRALPDPNEDVLVEEVLAFEEKKDKKAIHTISIEDLSKEHVSVPVNETSSSLPSEKAESVVAPKKTTKKLDPTIYDENLPDIASLRSKYFSRYDLSSLVWVLLLLAAFAGIAYYLNFNTSESEKKGSYLSRSLMTKGKAILGNYVVEKNSRWPESLQPKDLVLLFTKDDKVVGTIRDLLLRFQYQNIEFSASELKRLKRAANPASASLQGQMYANNVIALLDLWNGNPKQAKQKLTILAKSTKNDYATLFNLAVVNLNLKKYSAALVNLDAADKKYRRFKPWHSLALRGYVSLVKGQHYLAMKYYQRALKSSPNNPVIYGMWLQLMKNKSIREVNTSSLIRDLLWADPDKLIDSPVAAPIGVRQLLKIAEEGMDWTIERLESQKQIAFAEYLKWQKKKVIYYEDIAPSKKLQRTLFARNDIQSRILESYILIDQNDNRQALTKLYAYMLDFKKADPGYSWPWTVIGDIYLSNSEFELAKDAYKKAIKIKDRDVAAIQGFAISERAIGNYDSAKKRILDVRRIDSNFIPTRLNISRTEWHRLHRLKFAVDN